MIQGGDPNTKDPESDRTTWGQGGPGYDIDNEINTIKHKRGIVSMARYTDVDSAQSQFFIVTQDSPHLNGEYTAFGRLVPGTYSFYNLDQIADLNTDAKDAPVDASEAKIIKTEVINYSGSGYLLPPERLDSVIRPIKTGGGNVEQYISEKYDTTFNLPYRWSVIETSGDLLRLELKPDEYNHSVKAAVEKSGFIPQIFVAQEERGSETLIDETGTGADFVITNDAFFSIKDADEPVVLSNNLFENDDGRFGHILVTTQVLQTSTEPIKFKIIQLHFTNLKTNYAVIYVNVIDFFAYEINAFDQTVQEFKTTIDGKLQPINFASSPVYKYIIIEGRETPTTELPPPQEIGGCLIATASYGSELAPQVQQLRELRDYTVLQTKSGSVFMAGFNQFYYSFSPMIADYERENPAFKEGVKLAITPLLTSLTLLQYADINSESEMLGYGISIILLNIGMYFVAPAVLIMKVRSFYKLQ